MDNSLKQKLIEIYKRYGFEMARVYEPEQILVFTIKNGYFDNADIVKLSPSADSTEAFKCFSDTGYACTVRTVLTPEQAEEQLFKGFFSIDSILARLKNDYVRFTENIVAPFSESAKYEYINAPYQINGRAGTSSPAFEISSRLEVKKPTLFLVEAAAGFGKTCTAYELLRMLIERGEHLPLFSELSMNRQAVIFRYILLDEIDRSFPVLSSRLVQTEMQNGRVITILDGFDELLRKGEEGGDFVNKEPMLETIGELLTGCAKIVLTTRRTVLFEGDAFHSWVDKHADDFDLIKIRISEPQVKDWLPVHRLSSLETAGIDIENIANPVLLSYLRCISDADFSRVSTTPQYLVEKYFEFMLDREITRQDLQLDASKQQIVLSSIADDMMEYGYTSEQRDYIVDHIQRVNSKLLEDAAMSYPASSRPTKEEIANKLASHALLDRSQREPNKIGFVNKFVFGHFIGAAILNKNEEWVSDDLRFIEPAVLSYHPRSKSSKFALWNKLKFSMNFLPISDQIDIDIRLRGEISLELENDEAQGIEIIGMTIGQNPISNFQFNECLFKNCIFNSSNLSEVTFLNCRFYNNSLLDGNPTGEIYVLGGTGDQDFISSLNALNSAVVTEIEPDRRLLLERFVLEKFWPVGRNSIVHKHRPIKGICTNNSSFRTHELFNAILSLKKKKILLEPAQPAFVEINFDEAVTIREILGRQSEHGQ